MKKLIFFLPWVLCLFSSLAHAGYAEREPACAAGQVLEGGLCYNKCAAGETGLGAVCVGQCPSGTTDNGAVCAGLDIKARGATNRGAGTIPSSCLAGTENNSGLCYSQCRAGYYGNGPACWEATPSGWYDAGLWFWRWNWWLETRSKGSYGRGVGSIPTSCPSGKAKEAGLCYSACPAGATGVGPTCYSNCPAGYTNDGLTCRKDITTVKPSRGRGVGVTPPANDGYCNYVMPMTTKSGKDRLYSQTAFVGTHNAYSTVKDGYFYAQQTFDVQRQLEGGVRVINLDIHLRNNDVALCHEKCDGAPLANYGTSMKYLVDTLKVVKQFLDKNPNEIVTIVFESYVKNNALVEQKFAAAGLTNMVFRPSSVGISQMPTLRQMIQSNKRLVVLTQESQDAGALIKTEWNYFVENMYGFDFSLNNYSVTPRDLPLDTADRGFLFNHFGTVTSSLNAVRNNSVDILGKRVFGEAKTAAKGRLPTVLLVDFYQLPFCEAFKTVKDINDLY